MPFCGNCGNEMADTDKFCAECGSPIKTIKSKVSDDDTQNTQLTTGESEKMTKIKIISNPYQKSTTIQKWNDPNGWEDISFENSSNSVLVSDSIKTEFFQFKADEIVEGIVTEFKKRDEELLIVFEGTEDDYAIVEKIVRRDKYKDQIVLERSDLYLENASEVLPEIRKIFKRLEPIVEHCVISKDSVTNEMQKFIEASNDYIPIVVLGNYSSGKSTFINALLGCEILPSGDEPVTAKIYRIEKSEDDDRASAVFLFHDTDRVEIKFTAKTSTVKCDVDNPIVQLLKEGLSEVKGEDIIVRLGKALAVINSYENDTENQEISDLIEVTVPFNNGILSESESKYVIFDTPGSNSASNSRHLDVLKRAMKDMSNGIPMFVSEYNTLDSTDNEKLYTWINDMAELDSRFTMIIVNKADNAGLPADGFNEKKIKQILNWSVPKNLYSEGVFFVSSIMGLGAKTNGDFQNRFYFKTYSVQEEQYKDPTSRFYESLYRYNIMPEQLKETSIEQANECEDLVYANSGLYSVEMGLEAFAKKHSSYNKCEQSKLFLKRIIEITDEVISQRVSKSKTDKDNMVKTLEKNKAELLKMIDEKSDALTKEFLASYTDFIDEIIDETYVFIDAKDLKELELGIETKHQREMGINDYDSRLSSAKKELASSIKVGMSREVSNRSLMRLKKSFLEGLSEVKERREELKSANKTVEKMVSDELIAKNKADFQQFAAGRKGDIEASSQLRWERNANRIRTELAQIVMGTNALNEEQRATLKRIIIEYGDIHFDNKADEIFIKDDFLSGIRFGNLFIGDSEKIRLDKLRRTFNSELNKYVNSICKEIELSHTESFKKWLAALLADIRGNITEYSSELHTQVDYIKQEEDFIADFEAKQKLIMGYSKQIEEMISWKE